MKRIWPTYRKYVKKSTWSKEMKQFQIIKREFSTTESRHLEKYKATIVDGVVKSPFPDIKPPSSDQTIDRFIWKDLEKWPDHTAIECAITGQKYTYSELRKLCSRYAFSLYKLGIQRRQVMCVMLPNMPDYAVALLGAFEADVIVSPVNPIYTPYELAHQLQDCKAVAILTLTKHVDKIKQAIKLIEDRTKTTRSIKIIVVDYNNSTSISDRTNLIDYNEMISNKPFANDEKVNFSDRKIDDIAVLPYSSGTTGLSKGVQLTHRNCVSNFMQVNTKFSSHWMETTKNYQDTILGFLPFFHIYGISMILMRALEMGGRIVTVPKFEAATVTNALKTFRPTIMYVVPPIVLFFGNNRQITADHMASFRLMMNGAGPVGTVDAEKVLDKSNKNFFFNQAYGLTETSPAVCTSFQFEHDFESIGIPVASCSMKIIKTDGGIATVKEQGEICIKGPQVMLGYLNNQKATKEVIDTDNYFHSGDMGYYNEQGKFFIVDRMKELIKVQGYQVPPAELEAILRSHPHVADAAVIGISDQRTGEKPLAFVVKKRNEVSEEILKEFVSSKVAQFKQLAGVRFVDNIPKSQAGKILRRVIKNKYLDSQK